MSSKCAGFARDFAKVEDQVRFLARTLKDLTLEPDGAAIGCNPVEVGSTPTGVSYGSEVACAYVASLGSIGRLVGAARPAAR